MNSELYRRLKEYARAKIISQTHSSRYTKRKRFRRDSAYSKFVNSMIEEPDKNQREQLLKEQMNEIIDQSFKDAAANLNILTNPNESPKPK